MQVEPVLNTPSSAGRPPSPVLTLHTIASYSRCYSTFCAGRVWQAWGGTLMRSEAYEDNRRFAEIGPELGDAIGALRFRHLIALSHDAFVETDGDGVVVEWSPQAEAMFGWSAAEAVGRPADEFWIPSRLVQRYHESLRTMRPGDLVTRRGARFMHRDGFEVHASTGAYMVEEGGVVRIGGFARDLSAERAAEEALAHAYLHDSLTGLPNRTLFTYRLAYALARGQGQPGQVAVLILDLDRFKAINDALGHEVGDEVLVAVAGRIVEADGAAEVIARLGGDEFLVLFDGDGAESAAVAFSQRVLSALAEPFAVGGTEVFVTASVGIATTSSSVGEATPLLSDADSAMYEAKQRGGNSYRVFGESLRVEVLDRLTTEHALHHALERRELRLHYQPVVDILAGRPVAVEALIRWQHPEHGLVAPNRFIPVAEESGLIIPIGTWVLHEACDQLRRWRSTGVLEQVDSGRRIGSSADRRRRIPGPNAMFGTTVEVNLSARQIDHAGLVDTVESILRATGVAPANLTLEITESALMTDAAGALTVLRALKDLGVTLAIDDFGTGYSSLSYLQRFPLDILKIDKSFVDGLGSQSGGAEIVGAVVNLAHSLGMQVIAEGVETEAQLDELRRLSCDFAQGFLFSKPVPASDLAGYTGSRAEPLAG